MLRLHWLAFQLDPSSACRTSEFHFNASRTHTGRTTISALYHAQCVSNVYYFCFFFCNETSDDTPILWLVEVGSHHILRHHMVLPWGDTCVRTGAVRRHSFGRARHQWENALRWAPYYGRAQGRGTWALLESSGFKSSVIIITPIILFIDLPHIDMNIYINYYYYPIIVNI